MQGSAVLRVGKSSVRITELLHEVSRTTGLASAFTNLRTGESCDNENALLAAILADATNFGLTRMAAASQGVTRDHPSPSIWLAFLSRA
jgi:Tn3 transposase DDE domain